MLPSVAVSDVTRWVRVTRDEMCWDVSSDGSDPLSTARLPLYTPRLAFLAFLGMRRSYLDRKNARVSELRK